VQIVGKDTGILNYPREVSGPADADHHTICKYRSRVDDNYILFITFLKQISRDLAPPSMFTIRYGGLYGPLLMNYPSGTSPHARAPNTRASSHSRVYSRNS
jgi:hypothetical protein